MVEFKQPKPLQMREIRIELEKVDLDNSSGHIIPTLLAELVMKYCYEVDIDEFYQMPEAVKSDKITFAIIELFFKAEEQKKR